MFGLSFGFLTGGIGVTGGTVFLGVVPLVLLVVVNAVFDAVAGGLEGVVVVAVGVCWFDYWFTRLVQC